MFLQALKRFGILPGDVTWLKEDSVGKYIFSKADFGDLFPDFLGILGNMGRPRAHIGKLRAFSNGTWATEIWWLWWPLQKSSSACRLDHGCVTGGVSVDRGCVCRPYVCMYVSIYVCMYLSMYVCMYVCIYLSIYVCMYVRMYTYCIYTYIYILFTHQYYTYLFYCDPVVPWFWRTYDFWDAHPSTEASHDAQCSSLMNGDFII